MAVSVGEVLGRTCDSHVGQVATAARKIYCNLQLDTSLAFDEDLRARTRRAARPGGARFPARRAAPDGSEVLAIFISGVWMTNAANFKGSILQLIDYTQYVDGKLRDDESFKAIEACEIKDGHSLEPDVHAFFFSVPLAQKKRKDVYEFEVGDGLYDNKKRVGGFDFVGKNLDLVSWQGVGPNKTRRYKVEFEVD